jgi:hypothetical protein
MFIENEYLENIPKKIAEKNLHKLNAHTTFMVSYNNHNLQRKTT